MPPGYSSASALSPAAVREPPPEHRTLDLRLLWRLLRYMRPYARLRNVLLAIVTLRALQMPALAWAIGAIIKGPIAHRDVRGSLLGALGLLALAAFTQATLIFRQRLALLLGANVVHDIRQALFEHLQRMPLSFFHTRKLGLLLSRCTADVDALRRGVQDVLFVTIVNGGQMVVAAALMLHYDWVLSLVVFALAPIIYRLNLVFRTRLSRQARRVRETLSRVFSNLAESINGIRVTQSFVRQDANAGFFRTLAEDHSQSSIGVARITAIYLPLLELNTQIFMAALLVVGGWRVLTPATGLHVGDLISFFFLANLVFSPMQSLGNQYAVALDALTGAERVFRLLDTPPEWEDAPGVHDLPDPRRQPSPATTDRTGARVEFLQVTFGYDPARPVLHDCSFLAEPGQTVALVGHTGSGKSTITHLLGKFYLPSAGAILIDRHELRDLRGESLRRQMAFVTQTTFLFTGTILDNIRFGRPQASDAEIEEVCRRLACHDLITALPAGYHTVVGERGTGVSLGQRQLICFARALIADPRLLILDEATSAIDTLTEARLQRALATLMVGRTSFVVAHRLSTIVGADQILTLDHGRLIERGTHAELLARGGIYAELYRKFAQQDPA